MAVEIEAKMSVDSFDPVRERLCEVGAVSAGRHFEVNAFFDTEDGSLLAAGKGLRLRLHRDEGTGAARHIITWKGPQQSGPLKSREEVELEVDRDDAAVHLLEKLGFRRTLSFEKRRETWEFQRCRIELDEVPHLGLFVEIEGPDEQTVLSVRERLGLSHRPVIKGSYMSLLVSHLGREGRDTTDVTFADARPR